MVDTKKTTDNEDPKLGKVQAPQNNKENPELDTPDSDKAPADAAKAPKNQDDQEADNEKASTKPGEAKGPKTDEQKAAEKKPAVVKPGRISKKTNPVGQATEIESKDPYAEGKHIANPEPNNGNGGHNAFAKDTSEPDTESADEAEQTVKDQQASKAKADKEAEDAAK